MKNDTHNIKDILDEINGATFLGIDTETFPKLTGGKKNIHKDKIKKIMKGASVEVFTNKNSNGYANMVNRRLEKEGKEPFELKERVWGQRIPNTPVIEHNGKYYLEMIFLNSGNISYEYEENPINKDDIIGLPVSKEGEQGGLEDKVSIRTISFDSIVGLRINGRNLKGKFVYA